MADEANLDWDKIIHIQLFPESSLLYTTACICCMCSYNFDFPACCGCNDTCDCLCCHGGGGCQCLDISQKTRTCQTQIDSCQCLDLTSGSIMLMFCGNACISLFCMRGAGKQSCNLSEITMGCSRKGNQLCCDGRCAIPPTAELGVPMGIAIFGKSLWGNPGGSCGGGGGGDGGAKA